MAHSNRCDVPGSLSSTFTPTQLLLAFFGEFVLDRPDRERIPARAMIDVLGQLAVSEANARVTLSRMVKSGLLTVQRSGRTASYALTDRAVDVLRDGERRVRSADPFHHPGSEWTLLSYSVPESRRDLRHQIRSRLRWLGFGRIRDGLWIAPGSADVDRVLAELQGDDVVAFAFVGSPIGIDASTEIVSTAWDLESLSAHHVAFIERWSGGDAPRCDPLAAQVAMYADWLELLRTDPGLPVDFLPRDWPAARSVEVFRAAARSRRDRCGRPTSSSHRLQCRPPLMIRPRRALSGKARGRLSSARRGRS